MKVIKLDRRYHGFPKWTHALEFTKHEVHFRHRKNGPYVKAFREMYGDDHWYNPETVDVFSRDWILWNDNWRWDAKHRRIYFKDPSIMTFIELKIA